jgi:hypothetical protein
LARLLLLVVLAAWAAAYVVRLLERRRRDRLAVIRSAFLVSASSPTPIHDDGQELSLRSGAVTLRVPRTWSAEHPQENETLVRTAASHPLRITADEAQTAPPASLDALLRARAPSPPHHVEEVRPGLALLKCVSEARGENGRAVAYHWLLAATQGTRVRVVTASLTVPEASALDPLTRDTLALLDAEMRSVRLGPA